MAAKMRGRSVKWQKTSVKISKPYRGEKSPYWDWVRAKGFIGEDGEPREFAIANPDILIDPTSEDTPTLNTRAIMKLVLKKVKLSKGEKAVLNCIGIQGFTEEKTAELLGLTRRRVRICLTRAQKKCEKLFGAIRGHAGVIGREAYTEDEE